MWAEPDRNDEANSHFSHIRLLMGGVEYRTLCTVSRSRSLDYPTSPSMTQACPLSKRVCECCSRRSPLALETYTWMTRWCSNGLRGHTRGRFPAFHGAS